MFSRSQVSNLSPYKYFCVSFGPCAATGASAANAVVYKYRLPFKARFKRAELAALTETGSAQVNIYNSTDSAALSNNTDVVADGFTVQSTDTGWLDAGTLITVRGTTDSGEELAGLSGTLIFESFHGVNGRVNDF